MTHKFSIGGHESYLTVGFYPDTMKPGETFLVAAKEGSTVSGYMDTISTLISVCLQSGVPLKVLVRKFKDVRFEPAGFTENPDIPTAKSVVDYVFRYLGMRYLSKEDREEIFGPETLSTAPIVIPVQEKSVPVRPGNGPTHHMPGGVMKASADAPICQCGTLMVKTGACYTCPNCFASSGVCS